MNRIILLLLLLFSGISFCQEKVISGDYESVLTLAYNPSTHKLTGYYEDATGEDNKFSCIFYIEGTVTGKQFKIQTYFPNDNSEDLIEGTMELGNTNTVKIKLPEEHGGCWNVQHFADESVNFELSKAHHWIQINYITGNKSYFYKNKSLRTKTKSYVLRNNIVYVEKIENEWAYCTYIGDKTTKGWIKTKDLNQL